MVWYCGDVDSNNLVTITSKAFMLLSYRQDKNAESSCLHFQVQKYMKLGQNLKQQTYTKREKKKCQSATSFF